MKEQNINKHALFLLLMMSGLYFVSFFQRVAVPGTIFNDLQRDFTTTASAVTSLGSIYLLVYASLQLFIGMLADKHGGVKITLICGLFLCVGSVIFPLSHSLWLLYLSRALVGIGASGMYLCIIKETDTLFSPKHFAPLLGLFCMLGYGGGLFGTKPFRGIVEMMGWRWALLLMAGVTMIFLVLTYFAGRTYMGKSAVLSEKPVLEKTKLVIMNSLNYPLLITGMINFSIYFSIQAIIGPKFIGDFLKMEPGQSTKYTFIMMLFTLAAMLTSGHLSRMMENKRKPFLVFGSVNVLLAVFILLGGTIFNFPAPCFLLAYVMLAISGGADSGDGFLCKGTESPQCRSPVCRTAEHRKLCVGCNQREPDRDYSGCVKRKCNFDQRCLGVSREAYTIIFTVMLIFSLIAVVSSFRSRETHGKSIHETAKSA
jgi:MFS family permease